MLEKLKKLKEIQMIIFYLGEVQYAIPIMCVQEIIMKQVPNSIPKAPSSVEGVINLRGKVIPIIDGKKKFGLNEYKQEDKSLERIIVLDVDHEIIGLIVDNVSEVIYLKTEDIESSPIDMGEDNDFLWGVGKYNSSLLILINPQKFLSHTEAHDLKKLAKVTEAIKQATAGVVEENAAK